MIKIMILDDEESYLKKEERLTKQFFSERGISCKIVTYQNVQWFLYGLEEEKYDLYILDVEMPEKNGLEVAREIRKFYPNPFIIFVTNFMDYAAEAYEVNTYRYISKSILDTKLIEAYKAILPELINKEKKYYIIEKRGEMNKLEYSNIYYLKKENKYVVLVHRGGESRVRSSLGKVLDDLNSRKFIIVDKGVAVNLQHVMRIKGHDLYMRNGMVLAIGNARLGEVKKMLSIFWRGDL